MTSTRLPLALLAVGLLAALATLVLAATLPAGVPGDPTLAVLGALGFAAARLGAGLIARIDLPETPSPQ